ncbi:MAG TPA: CerR family C-terminal domain-containing protein [Myxococcaceae bacterium]|nr:CerR family C-terminal domain-containing protein [Myxococcaceae bacterium]
MRAPSHNPPSDTPPSPELAARTRLLDAGERLFAERGIEGTSIRDLAQAAGVNVAAVHYYFGGKEALYLEALRRLFCASDLRPHFERLLETARQRGTRAAAAEAFKDGISAFMGSLTDGLAAQPNRRTLMMMREMSQPTPALDVIYKEDIEPKLSCLMELLTMLRPDLRGQLDLKLTALSVVGQCLYYECQRPILERMLGPKSLTPSFFRRAADHVAQFTLDALDRGRPLRRGS